MLTNFEKRFYMVRIITDSTCDMALEELEQLNVEMLPLTVRFGDEIYRDGIDLSHKEFYEKLEMAEELPQTSQINPAEFEAKYREIINSGDDIVSIHIGGKLSGTLQSANIAADMVDSSRIYCVDSYSASFGMTMIIKMAVRMRDAGKSAKEIAQECAKVAKRARIVAIVSTLKYLKMGGRLSSGSAFIGEMLGIKPVALVSDGEVSIIGKARGERAALEMMKRFIAEHKVDYNFGVAFGHSNALENLYKKMEYFKKAFPKMRECSSFISDLGPVVGTHIGPGLFAVGYIEAE